MSRPWRIQFPGAVYHVTARGNNRQPIFLDDQDKENFVEFLGRAVVRFDLHVFAFCLMGNHYHLFLRTPEPNLSSAMKWLNATYTSRFHRRHRGCGHLFQGRYKSVLVEDDSHWLMLSFYIHLNPVRAKMVDDPAQYWWSSFQDYTRKNSRYDWLCPEDILLRFGASGPGSRRRYRRECLMLGGKEPSFWEEIRSDVVIGGAEFLENLSHKYHPRGEVKSVPEFLVASRSSVDVDRELSRVASVFKVSAGDLKKRSRNFPPRQAACYHLVEHCGLEVKEAGKIMGVGTSAVSKSISLVRTMVKHDTVIMRKIRKLNSGVSA